jgi:hypothetical protein
LLNLVSKERRLAVLPRIPSPNDLPLRVLRRMLNVAVRKKFLFANPCAGVEFPSKIDGLFRPHYVGWSEQQTIEFNARRGPAQRDPHHYRNGIANL